MSAGYSAMFYREIAVFGPHVETMVDITSWWIFVIRARSKFKRKQIQ